MDRSANPPSMTPSRPHLLRAIFDWLLENELTPHIAVNAMCPGTQVPQQFVQNGQIILNIAPHAVGAFVMDTDAVSFNARFGGVPHQVYIPIAAVLAIHARENGAGTVFEPEPAYESILNGDKEPAEVETSPELVDVSSPDDEEPKPSSPKGKPSLRVIK